MFKGSLGCVEATPCLKQPCQSSLLSQRRQPCPLSPPPHPKSLGPHRQPFRTLHDHRGSTVARDDSAVFPGGRPVTQVTSGRRGWQCQGLGLHRDPASWHLSLQPLGAGHA